MGEKNVQQEVSDDKKQTNKKTFLRNSLVVQWLRLRAPNAGDVGLIPGRGTKILCPSLWVLSSEVYCSIEGFLFGKSHPVGRTLTLSACLGKAAL